MNLLKQMGWVDWKFVPVDYENKEVSVQEIKQNETSNEELNDVSAVSPVLTAIEEKNSQEPHPASPLISKRMIKKLMKQEGEFKADDSKGII
jgi:hypothetical protein